MSNKILWKQQRILLLGPNEKIVYLRKISKKLEKKGYRIPYIMRDQKDLETEGSLTKKFERLYTDSDFVFSLFFHGPSNISVNYEIGFMTAKSQSKVKNKHRVLLEIKETTQGNIPVDLSKDNPYISSNEGDLYRTKKFKEKTMTRESFYDAAEMIHETIVNEIKHLSKIRF